MQLTRDYLKASNGSANASLMTVQNVRTAPATTILTNTVANVPTNFIATMGTPHTFTDPVTGEVITIISEATAVDFAGHIDSGHLEIDEIAPGYTDLGSKVGDIIVIKPTTRWADLLAEYVTPTGAVSPFAGSAAPSNWLLCDGASLLRADYPRLFAVIGTSYGAVDGTHFNTPDLRDRTPIGVGTGQFTFTFANTDVTVATDLITVTANPELITGRKVRLTTTGTLPTGLSLLTDYYVIVISSTTIKLATTLANAVAGTAIDITAQGTGTNTVTGLLTARTLGQHGGEEAHASTIDEMPSHNHSIGGGQGQWVRGGSGANAASINQGGSAFRVDDNMDKTGGSNSHNIMQPWLALNYIIKT